MTKENNESIKEQVSSEVGVEEMLSAKDSDFKQAKPAKPAQKRWYVVHTYSGHENKVKVNLEKRVE